MPRPIINNLAEFGHCLVDAPDAYFSAAHVEVTADEVIVARKDGIELDRYPLDRDPSFETDDKAPTFPRSMVTGIVAVTYGAPLIVRPDLGCGCHSTRKDPK